MLIQNGWYEETTIESNIVKYILNALDRGININEQTEKERLIDKNRRIYSGT